MDFFCFLNHFAAGRPHHLGRDAAKRGPNAGDRS
jgi:hypothetical protein